MAPRRKSKGAASAVNKTKIKNKSAVKKSKRSSKTEKPAQVILSSKNTKKENKKQVKLPQLEERSLTEEDVAFIEENKEHLGFLASLKPEELAKKVEKGSRPAIYDAKKSQASNSEDEDEENYYSNDSEAEQDYEMRPRVIKSYNPNVTNRLPIKTASGALGVADYVQQDEESEASNESEEEKEAPSAEEMDVDEAAIQPVKLEKPLSTKEQLLKNKEDIASWAQKILEDPIEELHHLRDILGLYESELVSTKKIALLSTLAVFKDIIPGYRIRPLTEVERAAKVSKEVAIMREHEESLLKLYSMYLGILETILKTLSRSEDKKEISLYLTAIRCVCTLVESASHFNFHEKLFSMAVHQLATRRQTEGTTQLQRAIVSLFEEDELGQVSLELVRLLSKMMKQRDYEVHPTVLDLFLHLRILTTMERKHEEEEGYYAGPKRKKDRVHFSKKARKAFKEEKKIKKEMKEAEAVIASEDRERNQSEALKAVFLTYFRVLKTPGKLVGNALEGIARFSHLINAEFFADLLQALRELVDDDNVRIAASKKPGQTTREALLTVSTALELVSTHGIGKMNLDLDLSSFVYRLYGILYPSCLNPDIDLTDRAVRLRDPDAPNKPRKVNLVTEMEIILKCYQYLFFKTRNPNFTRLASFTKALGTAALQLPEQSTKAALTLLVRILSRFSKLQRMLASDERVGDGLYQPFVEDPELCNSTSAILYEPFLLRNHYSPDVSSMANELLKSTTQ
ncbi:Noc2p-Noc3p complex subunit Noc3 [Schizosaccharomyces japonicus yFS275]|uniref:Nucleolar complex-associated protein 3 n=1 Tax=Schizosaccharomyces japonicus (strain yFS275 / FY16936) TaxID=402676 RepID=B6JVA4_SCHJY|nr:Noc2p-Noc3p complex subunit Noc3 [Schizosaccharomyces japonicus yFS275]EEB05305.2 Noc2p-Noc3p complex subunit Noc3 [Schizosaccharomyces japonicus yFS275]